MAVHYRSAILFVRDVAASRTFYEDLLEQQVSMDHGTNVGFTAGFAIWQLDEAYQTILGEFPGRGWRLTRENFQVYFEADDLDAVWQRLASAGVRVVHPMLEQPWGQRILRVFDPDGHLVELAEPMAAVVRRLLAGGLGVAEIATRTTLPRPIVEQIARETK